MDKLNGILTNINAALDKFQVGSGPLAGKSIASATQGLNFMEVGGREGRRRCLELQGAEEDGGWGMGVTGRAMRTRYASMCTCIPHMPVL